MWRGRLVRRGKDAERAVAATLAWPIRSRAGVGLGVLELVVVVLDDPLARRAPPARVHRRVAYDMAGRGGVVGVAGAPAGAQAQGAGQLVAGRAQLVDEARRALGVRARHHEGVALELAQALGEDVRRYSLDLGLEVAEPAR